MLRISRAFAVFTLLAIAAGCGNSHSSTPTTNVTTSNSPTTKSTPKHFDALSAARLTSAASVPKGPPHASGRATIKLSTKTRQVCWTISVRGVRKLLSAHVRKAPPGKIGPVIIPLGATFSKTGCVIAPLKAIKDVVRNPPAYYIDVLSRKYLNGALRGQLRARG
jgi:hypothetical protein